MQEQSYIPYVCTLYRLALHRSVAPAAPRAGAAAPRPGITSSEYSPDNEGHLTVLARRPTPQLHSLRQHHASNQLKALHAAKFNGNTILYATGGDTPPSKAATVSRRHPGAP
jgi:hypothetical protein